ncbi:alpha-L-rhamnosidase N-terminal domain-containing protein [Glaciecola sp. SC05]|uniref:glycoside hydrolase family 78 protein n=1 Tax=Glaciecola sp. SC05 TaxID=1987355 RepID=UPI003527B9C3
MNKRLAFILSVIIAFMLTLQACSDVNTTASKKSMPPFDLVINEGFSDALGFYDSTPNFSWKLPVSRDVLSQSQYQIVVASQAELLPNTPDLWDSAIVPSGETTFINYEGKTLSSRQAVYWQVKFWDEQKNESSWSEIAKFELGLLSNSDWSANWIEIDNPEPIALNEYKTPIHIPQHLRTEFTTVQSIKKARLYITAKGIFEAFINGQRVGSDILTPGYTPYKKRIE